MGSSADGASDPCDSRLIRSDPIRSVSDSIGRATRGNGRSGVGAVPPGHQGPRPGVARLPRRCLRRPGRALLHQAHRERGPLVSIRAGCFFFWVVDFRVREEGVLLLVEALVDFV